MTPAAFLPTDADLPADSAADLILVGAGLANCLLAWFYRERNPQSKILIFEAGSEMMRERTWSFHRSDIDDDAFATLEPLISKSWPGYQVRFPDLSREFENGYFSIRPADFEKKISEAFGADLRFNSKVTELKPHSITLANGDHFSAACVIDGRGLNAFENENVGYQKFFGMHVRLTAAHGLDRPLLMDATVEQTDGYRFVYVLPWTSDELLIEDTYYSNERILNAEASEFAICEYAALRGWKWSPQAVLSRECGSLPLPFNALPMSRRLPDPVPRLGVSAGFFHPVTGYSLPDAVRLADRLSKIRVNAAMVNSVFSILREYVIETATNWNYLCLLNRMMFEAAKPKERYLVLQHFYKLPDSLVAKFYRGSLTVADRVRILSGKPPVAMGAALKCLWGSGFRL